MNDKKHIAKETRWTTDGFMQRYEELCRHHSTYKAAYMAAEQEHLALFGSFRYSSYDSFRMTRRDILTRK